MFIINGAVWGSEPAKLRGLRGNVGYVGLWVAWVRGLRGSIFYVGCVGYVGKYFTCVIIFTWVAWAKYIFAWVFAWVNFYLLDEIILLCYN